MYYDSDYDKAEEHSHVTLTVDQLQQIYTYAVETRQIVRTLQDEVAMLKETLHEPRSPMEAFARNREQEYEEGIAREGCACEGITR